MATRQGGVVFGVVGLFALLAGCASGGEETMIVPGANGAANPGSSMAGSSAQMMVAMNAGSGAKPAGALGGNPLGAAGSNAVLPTAGSGTVDDGTPDDGAAGSGDGAAAGSAAVAGSRAPSTDDGAGDVTGGACCADGNCLCHGDAPTERTSRGGSFQVQNYSITTGEVYYPTDAEPPFAAVAICAGFLNTGVEMLSWGTFYASHGIVTVVVTTLPSDLPFMRADELLAAIDELKAENMKADSPLSGKLAGRYGTSGYSMGGGGTTIASGTDPSLRSSIGLAPWGGDPTNVATPTLLLCGDADTVAPCSMADGVYAGIPDSVPKMQVVAPGATHFNWFDPADAGGGLSGEYALAFEKVYLEGDERWKPLLLEPPGGFGGSMITSIH